jgi:hypothetical protein
MSGPNAFSMRRAISGVSDALLCRRSERVARRTFKIFEVFDTLRPRASTISVLIRSAGWGGFFMASRAYAAGVTSISLATLVGSGTGSPTSRSVWRCPKIASRTFRSVSSNVLPVLTQPGKSGTYAAQFVSVCSKMTAYFRFILSSPSRRIRASQARRLTGHQSPRNRGRG